MGGYIGGARSRRRLFACTLESQILRIMKREPGEGFVGERALCVWDFLIFRGLEVLLGCIELSAWREALFVCGLRVVKGF